MYTLFVLLPSGLNLARMGCFLFAEGACPSICCEEPLADACELHAD